MSLVSIFPNNLKSYPTGTYCRTDEPEFAIHKRYEGQIKKVVSKVFDGETVITELQLKNGSVRAYSSGEYFYPVVSVDINY